MPGALSRVKWFGRGPHETYPDRKSGAPLGLYSSSVDDTYVPYIIPSDNGGHSDCRWVSLTDGAGRGLLVCSGGESGELVHFSAHRFTAKDVHAARHPEEVRSVSPDTYTAGGFGPWLKCSCLRSA